VHLGASSSSLHAAIRRIVPPLAADRESGADVEKIVPLVRASDGAT
jgi:histidine ammonia-lyase